METFAQHYSLDFSHKSLHGLHLSKIRGGSPGFLETCATLKLKPEALSWPDPADSACYHEDRPPLHAKQKMKTWNMRWSFSCRTLTEPSYACLLLLLVVPWLYRLVAKSMCTVTDSVDLCSSNSGVTSGNCTAGRILVELNFLRMLAYALPNS